MNSGIYMYTFANGDNYVGQAIDIEKRLDQHVTKMEKGQHTKLIQDAYNKYGLPRFRVLLKCHPNYLDPMEAWCIKRVSPTLNSVIPICYDDTPCTFDITAEMLQPSLFRNLYDLQKLKEMGEESDELIQELEQEAKRLHKRVIEASLENQSVELVKYVEQLELDLGTTIASLNDTKRQLLQNTKQLKVAYDRIYEYSKLPWYKRIFHTI